MNAKATLPSMDESDILVINTTTSIVSKYLSTRTNLQSNLTLEAAEHKFMLPIHNQSCVKVSKNFKTRTVLQESPCRLAQDFWQITIIYEDNSWRASSSEVEATVGLLVTWFFIPAIAFPFPFTYMRCIMSRIR